MLTWARTTREQAWAGRGGGGGGELVMIAFFGGSGFEGPGRYFWGLGLLSIRIPVPQAPGLYSTCCGALLGF